MIYSNDYSESTKVIYENITYTGIKKIGFYENSTFGINLFDVPVFDDPSRRTEFSTTIAISPKKWRKENPTKAGYKVISPTHLIIFNDGGYERSLQIEDKTIVQRLIDECKSHELIAY